MAAPALVQFELFEAAETGDVAVLERLFAQPAFLEAVLALEARVTDDGLADPVLQIPYETAQVPADAWVFLHSRNNSIFNVAVMHHQYEVVEWFFTSPASNTFIRTLQIFLLDVARTAIRRHLDLAVLEMLFASSAWIQYPNEDRLPFFSVLVKTAIEMHRLSALNLLVAHGADLNRSLDGDGSPLSLAATCDPTGSLAYIVHDHGACAVGESSAIHRAAEYGQSGAIHALLEVGVDPRATNDQLETALHRAAEEGYYATIAKLLESACLDLDAQNDEGNTALNLAVQSNPHTDADGEEELEDEEAHQCHSDAIEILLQYGADPNVCSCCDFDRAPLHWAVCMECMGVVRTLLTRGADVNVRTTTRQQTPLHLLVECWDMDIKRLEKLLTLLLVYGADLACQDIDDVTPLELLRANDGGRMWLIANEHRLA